jgi:hypothetical protein
MHEQQLAGGAPSGQPVPDLGAGIDQVPMSALGVQLTSSKVSISTEVFFVVRRGAAQCRFAIERHLFRFFRTALK